MIQDLETKLDELLVNKAPYQIPKPGREAIVKAMPWAAIASGVLMLAAGWTLWSLLNTASMGLYIANSLGVAYGMGSMVPTFSPMIWLALLLLLIEAIIFFAASSGLGERKKQAWNLLYYAMLLSVVQAVVQFIGYTNIGTLLSLLLGTVIGLYVLFQIRGYYTVDAPPATGGQTPEPTKKAK